MRKLICLIGALLLAVALLSLWAGAALARPPEPSIFWGTVRVDGTDAPAGTIVSVWSGGVKWAECQMRPPDSGVGSEAYYYLDVPGDDPETDRVEGLLPGAPLEFHILRLYAGPPAVANEPATWQPGTVELNLTASQPPAACVLHLPQVGKGYHWGASK